MALPLATLDTSLRQAAGMAAVELV